MANYLKALQVPQWAKEATPGTLVAATSKIACLDFNVTFDDAIDDPEILNSLAIANKGYEVIHTRGVKWEVAESPLVYDQIASFLGMGIAANVITGANPYTYTATGDPTLATLANIRTFEARMTDGTTPSDWKFGYGTMTEMMIKCDKKGVMKFSAKGFARVLTSATLTAAQSLPTIVQEPSALTSVYIDTTFAGIGVTIVTAQALGWEWHLMTGYQPRYTLDARSTLDLTLAELNPTQRKATLKIHMLATASSNQWATEKTAAEALTLRAVELRAVNGANSIKIQGLYRHKPVPSVFPVGDDNGQQVVDLQLETTTDLTNWLKTIVINTTSTLV